MDTPEPKLSRRAVWLLGLGIWGTALLAAVVISHFAKLNFWLCVAIAVSAGGSASRSRVRGHSGVGDQNGWGTPDASFGRWSDSYRLVLLVYSTSRRS
jgi:hypothetical protein